LEKKTGKIKQLFYNQRHKITEFYKKNRRIYYLKYSIVVNIISDLLFSALVLSILFILFYLFLYHSQIVIFKNGNLYFDYTKSLDAFSNMSGIITTQVSISLMIVSISSLISNIEGKYIYGKRALELVFHKRGVLSFKAFLIIIFNLTFLNIYLFINQIGDAAIITVFLIAIIFVVFFVYKFANLFIGQSKIKKKLFYKYYRENLKHLKKAKPLDAHISKSTEYFKNVTVKYIREENVPFYRENIDVYFRLLEMSLFNHPQLIQEYYTESIDYSDLIAHIIKLSQELMSNNQEQESLITFDRLLKMLNYYQVVLVSNIEFYNVIDTYIEKAKYFTTETDLKKYMNCLEYMITCSMHQTYLYSIIDLSYCRLYKSNLIHSWCSSHFFEKLYTSIYENSYLSELDKSRIYEKLFDYIRMTEHNEQFPDNSIDEFHQKKWRKKEPDIYSVEIKAEPIALMILKMFENQDVQNIELFQKMNISNRLKSAIYSFVSLSIIEILFHDNIRTFYMDLNINPEFTIKSLKDSNFTNYEFNITELSDLYKLIVKEFTMIDSEYVSGSYYRFNPKFRFSLNVVDTYFLIMLEKNKCVNDFTEKNGINIQKDTEVSKIIEKII